MGEDLASTSTTPIDGRRPAPIESNPYGVNTFDIGQAGVLAPESELRGRVIIGLLTLTFGVSGLLMIPSGQLGAIESVLVGLAAASTIPVGLLWFFRPWPNRLLATLYVLWADIGIVFVLALFDSSFEAMPGCAMLSIVAVFAIVSTSPKVLTAHLILSVITLLTLAAIAMQSGADPWSVASRAVTLGSLFVTPFALRPYLRYLRERARGALRDPLTGLWNRRGLFDMVEQLNRVGAGLRPEARAIGVVVIDIDAFKMINDRYGHPTGDAVLVEVAERLMHAGSENSVVSRLGGDEFVCVHLGTQSEVSDAELRIRRALEESFTGPPVTTSAGSAGDTMIRGDSTGALLRRLIAVADIDLYRNKTPQHDANPRYGTDPLVVRDRIQALLDGGGPSVAFQPICDTFTSEVVGYEALSRFPFGHGSPMIWFRDATRAGVGPQLELAAIDVALAAMHTLPASAFVSINASAETIRSTDLMTRLSPHLATRTLYLEITEHERVDDYRSVARSVESMRSAGVKISVDDVGAGFAGLRQVVELRPDTLKIDYTLVHGIDKDPARRAAAAALAAFAREIGSTLIMEGVESEAELRVAAELGFDMVQGFYTGRPA
ncbi:MAG: EAL domain-containing protein [Rhodococcus sp. (in: high G+C Gram-positive bacteria)]|uniref:EAL domain-containing protein n=1 Tax=Rhodococcus sp. EPR-157 TaxID=1813677 RepID=UPI000ACAC622|nr:EAL domain-containing protein [Rhodococcus sp. EPR-157]